MQNVRRGRGFTLVEILVVIVILGLLAAMLLPAVQKAREAARVSACAGNLRQVVLALVNFEARSQHYPASWQAVPADSSGNVNGWSCQAQLLPFLEQVALQSHLDFTQSYQNAETNQVTLADGTKQAVSAVRVPTYLCPSERQDTAKLQNNQPANYPLNYAMNLGTWFVYDPATGKGGDGPFYPNSNLRTADIGDGLSFTLAAAEVKAYQAGYRNANLAGPLDRPTPQSVVGLGGTFRADGGHSEWTDGRVAETGFTATFPPNTQVQANDGGTNYDVDWINASEGRANAGPTYAAVTARSYHVGGVNAALLDGSVRWFVDGIHAGVWRAYATRAGGELIPRKS